MMVHPGASSGANASITFGASSTILRANDAMQMGCCFTPPGSTGADSEPKMPFLKKWVRTRHAILFRLSNRTVQVLFFDRRLVVNWWMSITYWAYKIIVVFLHFVILSYITFTARFSFLLRLEWWHTLASKISALNIPWRKCFKQVCYLETDVCDH